MKKKKILHRFAVEDAYVVGGSSVLVVVVVVALQLIIHLLDFQDRCRLVVTKDFSSLLLQQQEEESQLHLHYCSHTWEIVMMTMAPWSYK